MREGFTGVDANIKALLKLSDDGAFTLPIEITKAAGAVEIMAREHDRAQEDKSKVSPEVLEADLIGGLVNSAEKGTKLPDTSSLIAEAVRTREAATIRVQLVGQALETLLSRLTATVQGMGLSIITDHLRPALTDVLEAGAKAVSDLDGLRVDALPREVAKASHKQRKALVTLQDLGLRYAHLRLAYHVLELLGVKPAHDDRFGEFSNFGEVWPKFRALGGATEPPWPSDLGERLQWIIEGDAQPWMPTPQERDEAFERFVESNRADMQPASMRQRAS